MKENKAKRAAKVRHILQLLAEYPDASNRELGRRALVSGGTIARYRALIRLKSLDPVIMQKEGDAALLDHFRVAQMASTFAEPEWSSVLAQIERGHTVREVYAGYRDQTSDGLVMSERTFYKRVRSRISQRPPSMRHVYRPGDRMEVDFAGYQPIGLGADGTPRRLALFVAILRYSQLSFACVVERQTIGDWLHANEAALRFFGGVPERIVSDNLKAAVIRRQNAQAIINPAFLNFCRHYQVMPDPARPRKPGDKPSVEGAVKLIQRPLRLMLQDRAPMDLPDLNACLADIVASLNGRPVRRFGGQSRRERFEGSEKATLKPLPQSMFEFYETELTRKIAPDYRVGFEGSFYSVPHRLIGQQVQLKVGRQRVEIVHDGRVVALHPRSYETGTDQCDPSHMPPNHSAWSNRDNNTKRKDLEAWAAQRSLSVQKVAAHEIARSDLPGAARSKRYRSFFQLAAAAGEVRFAQACRRACNSGYPHFDIVRRLLEKNREGLSEAQETPSAPDPQSNVRGALYYQGESE